MTGDADFGTVERPSRE